MNEDHSRVVCVYLLENIHFYLVLFQSQIVRRDVVGRRTKVIRVTESQVDGLGARALWFAL